MHRFRNEENSGNLHSGFAFSVVVCKLSLYPSHYNIHLALERRRHAIIYFGGLCVDNVDSEKMADTWQIQQEENMEFFSLPRLVYKELGWSTQRLLMDMHV